MAAVSYAGKAGDKDTGNRMIKANFHTHTTLCDGRNTPQEMAQAAFGAGLFALGFSGHMDHDVHMDWDAYLAAIRGLQEEYRGRMDILLGVELDALYDPSCCPGAEFRIGSTHFVDVDVPCNTSVDWSPEKLEALCQEAFGGNWTALVRAYYELEATAYDRTECTFVGHFDLVSKFNEGGKYFDETSEEYLSPALEAMEYLVGEGVPFEVNCGALARGLRSQPYPRRELLSALHKMGGRILVNSDAHSTGLLCGCLDEGACFAASCGFTSALVLGHDERGEVVMREAPLGG
ncbi:PHP domain-containing protein [Olsenella sp. Marseille-P4559]|uniref:PHP domain-containing protein n=1 Tax=Olsenella sp. Marseille-P4559 TaxID=2364795 RepID=UPI001F5F3693|nr:PHP domain-containing protein [Olsenella sp. Marseille-P4559]